MTIFANGSMSYVFIFLSVFLCYMITNSVHLIYKFFLQNRSDQNRTEKTVNIRHKQIFNRTDKNRIE